MGRRNNYSFEKQQKENKRKKKQAEKLEKKRLAKLENAGEIPAETPVAETAEPGEAKDDTKA